MRKLLVPGLLVACSAVLYGLAFPTTGWTALAWISLAPLFVAIRRVQLGSALFLAWLWCVVGACVAGSWFPRAVAEYFHQPMPVALALFVAVFTLMAGPYLLAFAAAYRVLCRAHTWAVPFLTAAAWVAAELGRGRLLTESALFIGNPWGIIGYAHADDLALVQIASVTGIYGVSFVVVCVNAALAELWIAVGKGQGEVRRSLLAIGLASVPALASLAFGWASLRAPSVPSGAGPAVPVAIAQANVAPGTVWRSDLYGKNLEAYLRISYEAVEGAASAGLAVPRTVFWPETAMTFFVENEPLYRKSIARLLAPRDLELVAGAPRVIESGEPLYFNSVYTISPDGEITSRYDKEHLVPFAEYFPVGIDVLRREFGRVRLFERGTQTAPLETRAGAAGVVICNEAMLPEVVADRVARGAEFIFNPSNDTWISDPQYTEQQFDIARMRAIEQRRYLVRASTAGPSALIDPWGRILASTEALTRDTLVGEIRAVTARSIYGHVGDAFAVLCLAVVVVAVVQQARTDRRAG